MAHGDGYHGLGEYGTVKMRAAGTIAKGNFVKLGTNGVVVATDGGGCFGVADCAGTAGTYVTIKTRGVVWTTAASGVNFDQGDRVYIASASTVDAGDTADLAVGVVVYTDPATAGSVKIMLTPSESTYHVWA